MSTTTSIEWTDRTWNPVRGCALVSPGCTNCYAMRLAHRFSGKGKPYEGLTRLTTKRGAVWTGAARFVPEQLAEPLRWRAPARVFVNSMSDLFHEDVTDEQIAAVFGVMAACPQHTFQILTKRPERALAWSVAVSTIDIAGAAVGALTAGGYDRVGCGSAFDPSEWPLPNVWLGVSVEDRKHGVPRIAPLRACPAALRFLSVEPLLENVGELDLRGIGWVIVGGESGIGARAFDFAWARSVVAQCRAAGVPVFVKQVGARPVGEWLHGEPPKVTVGDTRTPGVWRTELNRYKNGVWRLSNRKGGSMAEWPEDLRVREFPEVRHA